MSNALPCSCACRPCSPAVSLSFVFCAFFGCWLCVSRSALNCNSPASGSNEGGVVNLYFIFNSQFCCLYIFPCSSSCFVTHDVPVLSLPRMQGDLVMGTSVYLMGNSLERWSQPREGPRPFLVGVVFCVTFISVQFFRNGVKHKDVGAAHVDALRVQMKKQTKFPILQAFLMGGNIGGVFDLFFLWRGGAHLLFRFTTSRVVIPTVGNAVGWPELSEV